MATRRASHNAAKVADVWTLTLGGTFEADDVVILSVGTKSVSITVGSTAIATIITTIIAAWNALDSAVYPEFAEYTAGGATSTTCTFTADDSGNPGTISVSTTEAGGGGADSQTASIAHTVTGTGPWSWDNAANWVENAVPTTGDDVYLEASSIPFKYGFAQTAVTLNSLNIAQSHLGDVALPLQNANGYREYRANYLAIKATTVRIGYGEGNGARRIWLDLSSTATAVKIEGSGSPIDPGIETILLKATAATNTLTVTQGSVGVAVLAGEAATFKFIKVGHEDAPDNDVKLRFGSGCTLNGADSTYVQDGGRVVTESSLLVATKNNGTLSLQGAAAVTSVIYNNGGKLIDESTGTITLLDNSADYDHGRLPTAKTITDCTQRKGSRLYDPNGLITWTNAIQWVACSLEDCPGTNFGRNRKFQPVDI